MTGKVVMRARKGVLRAGRGYNINNIFSSNPFFDQYWYYFNYENNGDFSRDHLNWKDGTSVINPDYKQNKQKHLVSLFIDDNTAMYIDCFGIEHIPQDILSKIKDKSITQKIFIFSKWL